MNGCFETRLSEYSGIIGVNTNIFREESKSYLLNNSYAGGHDMLDFGQMFESVSNIVKSLNDNSKDPLHVGEVMACWTYLAFTGNIKAHIEAGLNTTTDQGVQELLQETLKVVTSHKKELAAFMTEEGVTLPSSPEEKPTSDPNAIPLGAKFTDDEMVNTINYNFVIAADICAGAAGQCLRTDLAMMFIKYQAEKLSLGLKAKELMKKKGWLKIPPYYHPPGGSTNQKA